MHWRYHSLALNHWYTLLFGLPHVIVLGTYVIAAYVPCFVHAQKAAYISPPNQFMQITLAVEADHAI